MDLKKGRINLASPPKRVTDKASVGTPRTRRAADQLLAAYGSAIDIPRTELGKGAKFGETITQQALTFAVRREPVAKRVVMDVAEDIFDKWFTVKPINVATGKEEESTTLDVKIQAELERLYAKQAFTRAVQFERRYGWSIVVIGFKDGGELESEAESPTEIDHLAAYSPRSVRVIQEDEGRESPRIGLPVMYEVNRGKNIKTKVHYSRVLHIATRIDEHPWAGVPVLETIWDDMTVYRNIRWAAGQVYWRLAGLMKFKFPKDYKADDIRSFFEALGDPNARTFIGLPEDKDLEILSVAGRVLPPNDFTDMALRSISIGSGIPKTKMEGTEAGAVTGSEVNQREYYKYVSDQQKLYEDQTVAPLIDLMMEIGKVPDVDYALEWESAFQLDTEAETRVKLADAQAAETELRYMLVDEVRAKRNLKPLSEITGGKIDGSVLLSVLELQTRGTLGFDSLRKLARKIKNG